ncbi:MAG TPA: hypothetical protein PKO07_17955, partial [Pseudomonadota bacterium]|nr:hypothetical protein [Pseudomonadota bacterium]
HQGGFGGDGFPYLSCAASRRFVDAPDVYWGQDSFVNAWQATLIEPEHCDLERNGPRSQIPEVTMSSQFLSMMHLEVSGENAACTML